MRLVDGRYRRPFLELRRATTRAACAALGLEPWDDPHNVDPAFRRVRLRREVLPLLEDVLAGGAAEALARTAGLLGDDLDALDEWAAAVLASAVEPAPEPVPSFAPYPVIKSLGGAGGGTSTRVDQPRGAGVGAGGDAAAGVGAGGDGRAGGLRVEPLADLPRAVRTRVLRAWAHGLGAQPLTAERTAALEGLVTGWHGQGPIELPGGVSVRRRSGTLEAIREPSKGTP
jgi:tRNA(Ile)-lysidine synthase